MATTNAPIPVKLHVPTKLPVNQGGHPVEIPSRNLGQYKPFNTSTSLRINNFMWANSPVKPGKIFLSSQGRRLIIEANNRRVIYMLVKSQGTDLNKIFMQPSAGFVGDIVSYPYEQAGRDLQTVKKLAEYEIQILIGILSTTSWTSFAIVASADALQFFVSNKDNLSTWGPILKTCLEVDSDLRKYTPTLRNKLIYSTLLIALEGSEFAISHEGELVGKLAQSAVENPNVAGRGMGIIAGKLTRSALDGKLSVLSAVWAVLLTFVTKTAAAIPGAVSLTKDEIDTLSLKESVALAGELIAIVSKADIELSEADAKKITEEVSAHPNEIKNALQKLSAAFQTI